MFSVGSNRREFLKVGALAVGGLTFGNLLRAKANTAPFGT